MDTEIIEVLEVFDSFETKVEKCISSLRAEFMNMKAGRANPHILDKVTVDYYGAMTPLSQMANISIPEARLMTISVWDKSALKSVEKAITAANIGLTPNNDGNVIRLVFPELTQDRRKDLVKQIKTLAENSKVTVRNARRDANDILRKLKKDTVISEDECANFEIDVDKLLGEATTIIDNMNAVKEKEVMSV